MINFLLCGGSGTRLWPISRKNFPKQFCKLIGEQSLFQNTISRNLPNCSRQMIIANKENVFMAMDQIEEAKGTGAGVRYVLEPVGRNTAPAIALGCFYCDPDDVILVTPTDHMIQKLDIYEETLQMAQDAAKAGYIVTFGIMPTAPETGYGYIESEESSEPVRKVVCFKEKPDAKTAQEYVDSGRFYWNSGMFCFTAKVFLEELEKYAPEIYNKSKKAFEASLIEDEVCNVDMDDMLAIPSDSIDYAVMEKSDCVKVIPSSFVWNDVGSYDALETELPSTEDGNTDLDHHISINSKNNMIYSDKVIATVDVEDLIIVDTIDAMLIAKKGSSQKVKDVVNMLNKRGKSDKKYSQLTEIHTTAYRPWGSYTVLEEHPRFKMKRIVVKPGKRLSLQKHHHRSEHWVVVSGSALVTKGSEEIFLKPNESVYINMGEVHRMENQGMIDLVFLEVQVGEYLGEDDIVRLEDDYDRS
ncbi:mannose-1-phosphate guanylyltransferase/ mannose-6-phosphate isomerase [Denitrovibrio acetiphilus DSM 12809]|uniref:mannose-1-phosphate guanylyltransferase n=1 Tax=Denitrovibrio acetiphilus (strain DSM 12809 / NBRC 114555 / N2460) TaxID=522772 RepID=D4H579_DENA2|nr:mannose-1-phosphate guanylyltransferase/mannose-6-phosphate isomerase [Denitrovibrio acetiphilus]ADD69435.1 mannose-1-phosphate guanylyltransferase/ mannose-6-phosphate isomerase [Denitrovibrio acetiphilus DSM 12809]